MRRLLYIFFLPWIFFSHLGADCPLPLDSLPTLPLPLPPKPPVQTCSTPTPDSVTGYLPITIVNGTNLAASDIYIAVLVNSSTQYLSFSGATHKLATISSFTPATYLSSTSSPQYTYRLNEFENIDTDTYTFYIPNTGNTAVSGSNYMTSSRILVSLKEPLGYFINNLGQLQTPSEFDPTSDIYYILNDKIEFDLGSNGHNRLNLNLTGVDFFGLSMLVQANYQFLYGTDYSNACGKTGMPTSVSLSDVFTQYETATNSLLSPFNTYWSGLFAKYTNPGGGLCKLRIYAPATAMGSTYTQSNPTTVSFPTNYFLPAAYSTQPCTWFNAVWQGTTQSGKQAFYQNQKPTPYLQLDATTKHGSATAQGYEGDDNAFHFKILGGPDNGKTVVFPSPTSSKAFFTGAVSDYQPAITSSGASSDTLAQILKVFATSIIAGFTPIDCKNPEAIVINNTYVQNHPSNYFQNNAILTQALSGCSCVSNIPWYDFYSRTLLTIGSPNFFYTSAYSDFLGTDGTIVITNLSDHNADATITVTLNDCTGITFPDPYSDTQTYSVTVGLPANVNVEYSTTGTPGSFGPLPGNPFSAQGNQIFFQVAYTSGIYQGQTFVTQVAPAAKIFHPILPGQGQITTTGLSTTVSIGAGPLQ